MKNISFMAMFAAFLLTGCKQDAQVKFAGEEGAKVTFSATECSRCISCYRRDLG